MQMEWTWRSRVRVSDELGQVLNKLLQDMVSNRYQSAVDALQALNLSSVPPNNVSQTATLKVVQPADATISLKDVLKEILW